MRGILRSSVLAALASGTLVALAPAVASASITLGQTSLSSTGDCATPSGPYTEVQSATAGSPGYAVPAGGGVITSWNHQGGNSETGQLKLKIYRPVPMSSTHYTVVGQSDYVDLHPNALDGGPTRIGVQEGDLLGYTRSATAVMHCLFVAGIGDTVQDAAGADTAVGSTTVFSGPSGPLRINISAVLEPDADHDGFGDETQDQCPTNASTQGPCPVTPASAATGQRAAALRKCKKKRSARARRKCRQKAKLLPL